MHPPVTLKDLASALGLSVSTVARTLAGSPRIGKATVERVKADADRRSYVVDLATRAVSEHCQLLRHDEKLGSAWSGIAGGEAMRLGVAHLAALGRRRIAFPRWSACCTGRANANWRRSSRCA